MSISTTFPSQGHSFLCLVVIILMIWGFKIQRPKFESLPYYLLVAKPLMLSNPEQVA